jgi:hypothetical protein
MFFARTRAGLGRQAQTSGAVTEEQLDAERRMRRKSPLSSDDPFQSGDKADAKPAP